MFWRLGVLDRMREWDVGTITIYYFTIDGQEVKNYEFVGAGSDGGTWEWRSGTDGIEVALTSNFSNDVVTVLRSRNWGNTPPVAQPWFDYPSGNDARRCNQCLYLNMPNRSLSWSPKK